MNTKLVDNNSVTPSKMYMSLSIEIKCTLLVDNVMFILIQYEFISIKLKEYEESVLKYFHDHENFVPQLLFTLIFYNLFMDYEVNCYRQKQ